MEDLNKLNISFIIVAIVLANPNIMCWHMFNVVCIIHFTLKSS